LRLADLPSRQNFATHGWNKTQRLSLVLRHKKQAAISTSKVEQSCFPLRRCSGAGRVRFKRALRCRHFPNLLFRATCTLEALQSVVRVDFPLAKIVAKRCVCGNQQPIR
jgi:hypothetical protein